MQAENDFKKKRFYDPFPQPVPLVWSSIFQLALGEEVLEELINRPRNGGGGHLVDDTRLDAFEVAGQAVELVHRPEGIGHARQPAADVGQREGHVLLSVEKGLTDVQGVVAAAARAPASPPEMMWDCGL